MPNSPDIDDLFVQAIRLPPDERTAFVDECSSDSHVRDRLNVLLEAHDEAPDFLESPLVRAPVLDLTTQAPLAEGPGATIDRYKLLELIGEGGFGAVYMADQKEPVRRKVALKIIKLGMDTKQVIARFEAERQALAMMDHPNIAKVLDAGATSGGRPYFVMELVKGVPITEYCDTENLTTKERLDLFIILSGNSPYDQFVAGDDDALTAAQERGMEVFMDKADCATCHTPPLFTNGRFYNTGVGMSATEPDVGRMAVTERPRDKGRFRVPSLRDVADTAPYFHDGGAATLAEAVELMAGGGLDNAHLSSMLRSLREIGITPQDKRDLVEFLKALSGDYPISNRPRCRLRRPQTV